MNLEAFVQEEQDRLQEFRSYWKAQVFPPEMNAGEWLEQYAAWLNSKGVII